MQREEEDMTHERTRRTDDGTYPNVGEELDKKR
jgi:hypothetical protein